MPKSKYKNNKMNKGKKQKQKQKSYSKGYKKMK